MNKKGTVSTSTHTHTRILFRIRKREILLYATTSMDLEYILLNETSEIEKDKYCILSLKCGIFKK